MVEGSIKPGERWIVVAAGLAIAVWLCYAGMIFGLAGHYAASSDPDDWLRASHIEPANPENWYRLGRFRELDFDHQDVSQAISFFRRAVQLNSRSAFYKLDLASALEIAGDNAEAEKYYRAAQENYPISAEVSWKYGNFLLRQQRLPEAYAEIHRAVLVDPKMISLAVSRAWHSDPDVHVLLDQVLPNTAEGGWGALSYLTEAQEPAAAMIVWNHLIARKPAIDWKQVYPFLDMLMAQERYEDAGAAWRQATTISGRSLPPAVPGSLVFDGGFERDLSQGGFGWREEDISGASFDFDTTEKHSGTRSARIDFDGTQNLMYMNLYQVVLVVPGTQYHFRAYLREDRISTDSGLRFEIFDPKNEQNLNVFTPNETGTVPWTLEQCDFTAGPATNLIRIRLTRTPSKRFDNKLSGTVWVDDVELVPVATKQ